MKDQNRFLPGDGTPQLGQITASSLTSLPHSLHDVSAIRHSFLVSKLLNIKLPVGWAEIVDNPALVRLNRVSNTDTMGDFTKRKKQPFHIPAGSIG